MTPSATYQGFQGLSCYCNDIIVITVDITTLLEECYRTSGYRTSPMFPDCCQKSQILSTEEAVMKPCFRTQFKKGLHSYFRNLRFWNTSFKMPPGIVFYNVDLIRKKQMLRHIV